MRTFRIAQHAQVDIESISIWTAKKFGDAAAYRYERLIAQVIVDITTAPGRQGVAQLAGVDGTILAYHLRHSRTRVKQATFQVKHPRHFVVFKVLDVDVIVILRVLHDVMDLASHL